MGTRTNWDYLGVVITMLDILRVRHVGRTQVSSERHYPAKQLLTEKIVLQNQQINLIISTLYEYALTHGKTEEHLM